MLREVPLVLVTNQPKVRESTARMTVVAFLSSSWGFTSWRLYTIGDISSGNSTYNHFVLLYLNNVIWVFEANGLVSRKAHVQGRVGVTFLLGPYRIGILVGSKVMYG